MKEQLLCKVTSRTKRQLSVDVNRPIQLLDYPLWHYHQDYLDLHHIFLLFLCKHSLL